MTELHPHIPSIKCLQNDANTCCFNILASALYASVEYVTRQDIALHIQEYMVCQSNVYVNIIRFTNNIMIGKERNKGGKHCLYKIQQWKRIETFENLNDINDHINLVQLMDTVGNGNREVRMTGF